MTKVHSSQLDPLYVTYSQAGYLIGQSGRCKPILILRDTGCTLTLLRRDAIPADQDVTYTVIRGVGDAVFKVPLAEVVVDSELVRGKVLVGVVDGLPDAVDLLLGK